MDLICHLAGNKNVIKKFELVEKLKRNNKELAQSSYQLSWNCNDHFNVLLSAFQHFSGKFSGRLHWAVYNFWKANFQVPPGRV